MTDPRAHWNAAALPALSNAVGWVNCPACGAGFSTSDLQAWNAIRHRRCGQRLLLSGAPSTPPPIWCVVGNIVGEAEMAASDEARGAAQHLEPGARVYCFLTRPSDESVRVVGRHRTTHRPVDVIVDARLIERARATLIYSPHLVAAICAGPGPVWSGTEESRECAERLAGQLSRAVTPLHARK